MNQLYYALFNSGITMLALYYLIFVVFGFVFSAIGRAGLFHKAHIPAGAAFIPFISNYDYYNILYGNGWLFLIEDYLLFSVVLLPQDSMIKFVNAALLVALGVWNNIKLPKCYGRYSKIFPIGLLLCNPIFILILGFGSKSHYYGAVKDGTSWKELKAYVKSKQKA